MDGKTREEEDAIVAKETEELFALPPDAPEDPLAPNPVAISLPLISGIGALSFLIGGTMFGLRQASRRAAEVVKEGGEKNVEVVEKVLAEEIPAVIPGTRVPPRQFAGKAFFIGTGLVVGVFAVCSGVAIGLERAGVIQWPQLPRDDGRMDVPTKQLWDFLLEAHRKDQQGEVEARKAKLRAAGYEVDSNNTSTAPDDDESSDERN